jgi:hypothetical protein
MKGLIAEGRLGRTGALKVKTGVVRISHGDPAMHLNHLVAHKVECIAYLHLGQADQSRCVW